MDHQIEKKTRGRQKIEMVKIQNENHLLVTFSKRKKGLFKKSNEITVLTGAQLVVVIKSPSGKAFVYGSPCVEQIINRYLGDVDIPESSPGVTQLLDAQRQAEVSDLCTQLKEVNIQIEIEKKRGEELDALAKEEQEQEHNWWEFPKDGLNLEQLNELKAALALFQSNVEMKIHQEELMENTNPEEFFIGSSSNQGAIPNDETNPRQYFAGSSSNQGATPNDETNPWLFFLRSSSNQGATPNGETNHGQFFAGSSSNQGATPTEETIMNNNMASFNANMTGYGYNDVSNTVTPLPEYNPDFSQGYNPTVTDEGFNVPNMIALVHGQNPNSMDGGCAFSNMIAPPSPGYDIQNMVAPPPQGYDPNMIAPPSQRFDMQNMIAPPQGYDPNMVDQGHNAMNMNAFAPQGYSPDMGDPGYNFQNLIAPPPLGYNPDTMDEGYIILNAIPPPLEHNDNPQPDNNFDPPGFGPGSF